MSPESKRWSEDFAYWSEDKDLKTFIEAAKLGEDPEVRRAFYELVIGRLTPPQYSLRRKTIRESGLDPDIICDLAHNLNAALRSRAPLKRGTDPQWYEGPAVHRKSLGYVQSQR